MAMNTTSIRAGIPPDADRERYSAGSLPAYSWILVLLSEAISPFIFSFLNSPQEENP